MRLALLPDLVPDTFRDLGLGFGGPEGLGQLAAAQYSLTVGRMELVRRNAGDGFLAAAVDLDGAWELLAAAEMADQEAARAVIEAPTVGAWAARCLSVLCGWSNRGRGEEASAEVTDSLIHAWTVAAAAAVAAKLAFACQVPVRNGLVALPTQGALRVPDRSVVSLRSDGVDLYVDDRRVQPPEWLKLRRIVTCHDGLTLQVELDDVDPYRTSDGLNAADRLSEDTVDALRDQLGAAWSILVDRHRSYAEGITTALRTLVVLDGYPANRGVSAAYRYAHGSVGLTMPTDPVSFAVTLLHETQHIKLNRVLDLLDLQTSKLGRRFRAPWRDDPRPLEGLMHGAYAFAGVIDFWRAERAFLHGKARAMAEFEFARWRSAVMEVLDTILDSDELTAAGNEFFGRLRDRVRPWLDDPVPAPVGDAARQVALDDHACWRLRNHRVDAAVAADLAERYLTGQVAPPPTSAFEVQVGAGRRENHNRQDLLRLQLVDPDRLARLAADPSAFAAEVPGGTAADLAYADGLGDAEALYLDLVRTDPRSVEAWAGLAMCGFRRGRTDLMDCLELAFATQNEVARRRGGSDPIGVIQWFTAALNV